MDNIDELQSMWQQHKPTQDFQPDPNNNINSVLTKIRKTEKKVLRRNIIKTFAVIALILTLIGTLSSHGTPFVWLGLGLMITSTVLMLIIYWNIQFKSSNLQHALPQKAFVADTIDQIKRSHARFVKLFIAFGVLLVISLNLIYTGLLSNLDTSTRWLFHIGVTAFLIIALTGGLFIRKMKFKNDFQHLINELESLLTE